MGPHQEETKLVDLGTGSGKKEVKIGTGMTTPIREELTALLKDYQDIFAWSYQDMSPEYASILLVCVSSSCWGLMYYEL